MAVGAKVFRLLAAGLIFGAAQAADGAATASPGGLRVQTRDVLAPDFDTEADSVAEKVEPLSITGAPNGTFSGKAVVASSASVRNLVATCGDLKGDRGSIPASAVTVRFGVSWGQYLIAAGGDSGEVRFGARPGYLGLLSEQAPGEMAARTVKLRRPNAAGQSEVTYGPVAPVWVTVKVPRGTAPGTYKGQLSIRAEGEKAREVPVELKVLGWTVPDPAAWRTWVELIQSPDTLAMEYEAPLWGEAHWGLMERSLRLMGELGNRIAYVPLICRANVGNEQSMVRWTRKGDGGYGYDFSVMDRYLDTVERCMGKPQVVVFYVWENYMIRPGNAATGAAAAHEQQRILDIFKKENLFVGKGPAVTFLDPKDGSAEMEYLPHYTEGASKALWQPLMAALKERMAKRGLKDAMMLGMINDCWPTKEEVEFFREVAPEAPWVLHAHFGRNDAYGLAKIGYRAQVWSLEAPSKTGLLGWNRPALLARFTRNAEFFSAPLVTWRYWAEYCIAGSQRGVARLGADFWPVMKNKHGERQGRVCERYPESGWRNLGIYTSLLGPGSDGPAATTRFEVFREGMQECEARIAIERALTDEGLKAKLGSELAERCQTALDERIARMRESPGNRVGYAWNLTSGWQRRSETLYGLAGEVAGRLGGK